MTRLLLGSASHEPLRRALLQRLADDLAVPRLLAELMETENVPSHLLGCWPCCWVAFPMQEPSGRVINAIHRICPEDCPHWHHQTELFLA